MPIKPFPLSLLTAISAGEAHAYAIEQQMIADVRGAITIQSRAVYRELPRLVEAKFIEAVANTRPQRYRLTQYGRRTLHLEREHSLYIYRLLQKRL